MKIVCKKPSGRWGEAFPIGNGHMGAMVYGSLPNNRIDLSENTFFSGEQSKVNNQENASKAFYRMREQAEQGHYEKVHETAEEFIGVRKNYGTNLPVGYLNIDYGISPDDLCHYERSLDIINGIATCTFTSDKITFTEEVFVSHPNKILAYHINSDKNSSIKLSFIPNNSFGNVEYDNCSILFTCHAFENMHCDELCGTMLVGNVRVVTAGTCSITEDGLLINDAKDILVYLNMNTDFKREYPSAQTAQMKLAEETEGYVANCLDMDFFDIKADHQKDISKIMGRVDLHLQGKDQKIESLPILFQYGRYLLLSSSRSDSILPAHLQGIWNDNVACRIGWTCDMHLDINTQMNYWPAEITNLSETTEPLFRWIKDDLSQLGKITAKESYGLDGWVGELVSNAWGYAAPYWASPIAPCPTGGVWILMHMWEHYLFTEDEQFLQDIAYPLIESAAGFFNQYIFEDKKSQWLTSGPSISPENSFLHENKAFQISNGCTYEILMIRELFQVYQTSGKILGNNSSNLYLEISDKLDRLLPYRITKEGTIAEWQHDLPSADAQHRHTSHLLGLFPFAQLTPEETPELCKAAQETIRRKLMPEENWEDTGWARSMLMLYEARLHNGNKAYEHIKSMVDKLLEPNKMVFHPPTRGAGAFDHVYELDGNTGLTSCMAEMLLQSHNGIIQLLPSLPDAWEKGCVTGLLARRNIWVDISWEKGQLQVATLLSKKSMGCRVSYQGLKWEINLLKDIPYIVKP